MFKLENGKDILRTPADNEGFGVRRGVVSWDTSQDFGSSPPVRAFVKPRPPLSPRHVIGKRRAAQWDNEM